MAIAISPREYTEAEVISGAAYNVKYHSEQLVILHDKSLARGQAFAMARSHIMSYCTDEVYVRAQTRFNQRQAEFVHCVTLANISVKPEYQRKGFFKQLLDRLEELSHEYGRYLVIENVLNWHLDKYIAQRGGYEVDLSGIVPTYWKKP